MQKIITMRPHHSTPGFRLPFAGLLIAGLLVFTSCDRTRNDKGYEYFPDMAHSLAHETWAENPVFPDGKTMQAPPEGTVPREMIPYPYPATPEGRDAAGIELSNPFEPSPELLARGKELYQVFCQQCHGELGDGKGSLFTSGKYVIPPSNLISEEYKQKPAGETYHVITRGWGVMGAHGAQIKPEDRWKIVSYVETILQGK
jgi:mono/diheme cytochrome c family protein